ncbi:hypothetical protein JCM19052_2107 [Vibrio sp. JCM 19052]|nr:hypothetical protein JCM19052_2107 [Vibrio sp. JCM 19052]
MNAPPEMIQNALLNVHLIAPVETKIHMIRMYGIITSFMAYSSVTFAGVCG